MWRLLAKPPYLHSTFRHRRPVRFSSTAARKGSPLRILFFGSDEFSVASLKALHKESVYDPSLIASIDVVTPPPRPHGRGLKELREGK
jgi:methionyl-tRNA formyltransferase